MKTKATACKNCEQEHEVGFEFCPHCGQRTNEDLTVGELFYNTISNYFSFDARFFKSFIPLMFKPGKLAKRFIEGKRLLYLHPAQMYLFISVVFFFLFSFIAREQTQKLDKVLQKEINIPVINDSIINQKLFDSINTDQILKPLNDNKEMLGLKDREITVIDSMIKSGKISHSKSGSSFDFGFNQKKIDSLIDIKASDETIYNAMGLKEDSNSINKMLYKQMLKFYKQRTGGTILQTFYDSIPIALFILLPIFAMMLKLFFWRKGRFAHHLVFSFYYYSFLFTVLSIILLANFIWDIPNSIDTLIVLSTFFYLFFAIKNFYGQSYFLSFFKTCTITFIYMIFVIPIAFVVMASLAFLLY